MRMPVCGAVTGWAACRLYGGNFFDGLAPDGTTHLPVPLAIGPGGNIRIDDEIVLTYDRLPAATVTDRAGIRVVVVGRAVFDTMRLANGVREATVALEMAVAAGLISIERLGAYTYAHPGMTKIAQVRDATDLAREGSRSPAEVRFRLIWELDAGLPRPEVNCPIHDREGQLLGIADLLDPVAGLVAEFDGADHRGAVQHTRDVAKDEAFRSRGLEITRITGTDLRDRDLVVRRLHGARARARFEPEEERAWVARPLVDCAEARLREQEERNRFYQQLAARPGGVAEAG